MIPSTKQTWSAMATLVYTFREVGKNVMDVVSFTSRNGRPKHVIVQSHLAKVFLF